MRLSRGIVSRLGGVVVTLAAGIFVVTAGSAAHAATAPTPPYTAFTVEGAGGIGTGVFDPSNATITNRPNPAGIDLEVSAGSVFWGAIMFPPTGGQFTVGQTYETRRTSDATHAGFDIGGSTGCNEAVGSLTFKELVQDPDTHETTAFAISYTYNCGTTPSVAPSHGELRFNSTIGYAAGSVDPAGVGFGNVDIGQTTAPRTITVTSLGSDPLVLGAASIGGLTPDTFSIVADNCAGQSLAYGQTCTVQAAASPTASGQQTAFVLIPDTSGSSSGLFTSLQVDGVVGAAGTFYPTGPTRILDTRSGVGAPKRALGAGGVIHLTVAGHGGVPLTGVSAVVLNVTVTRPTSSSFLTLWGTGSTRPTASNLNFTANWTGANSVTVPLGTGGRVDIYNARGTVQVIADVLGFYAGNDDVLTQVGLGGQFQPTEPGRFIDSRTDLDGPLPGFTWLQMSVHYPDEEVNGHVRALAVNITAVNPAGTGYLTSWNGVGDPPLASTLDFTRGKTVANYAIVPVAACDFCTPGSNRAMFAVYNGSSSATHFIVDVFGFYDDSTLGGLPLRFRPLPPTRIADSRTGLGIPRAIGANSRVSVHAPSTVAGDNTWALQMNVTAVSPTANTFLTVWPDDASIPQPLVSNLNPAKGVPAVPNAVVSLVGPNNNFLIYNSAGSVNVVVDVDGSFELGIFPDGTSAARRPNAVTRTERPGPKFGGDVRLVPSG